MRLISGASAVVAYPVDAGRDRYGAPVVEYAREAVEDVLASPGSTADLDASRPEGARVAMTFHFPKGYTRSLKGALVEYGGRRYRVVGDPQPYMPENTPGEWNRAAEAEAVDG